MPPVPTPMTQCHTFPFWRLLCSNFNNCTQIRRIMLVGVKIPVERLL